MRTLLAGCWLLVFSQSAFAAAKATAFQLAARYALTGIPSAILLDASGKVLHRHDGFRSAMRPPTSPTFVRPSA